MLGELNLIGHGTIPRIEFSSTPSSTHLDHLYNLHSVFFDYDIGKEKTEVNRNGERRASI